MMRRPPLEERRMRAFTIATLLLAAVTMGLSFAHALELPGKLRLDEAQYKTVQEIYYPGFTLGGLIGELGGLIALAVLLYLTPYGGPRFWWTLAALGFLAATHAIYWLVTHPVNNFWAKDVAVSPLGSSFFSFLSSRQSGDWRRPRDVWEFSHVVRAALATLSLASLTTAATLYERTPG
jgi:hypothetical protein